MSPDVTRIIIPFFNPLGTRIQMRYIAPKSYSFIRRERGAGVKGRPFVVIKVCDLWIYGRSVR